MDDRSFADLGGGVAFVFEAVWARGQRTCYPLPSTLRSRGWIWLEGRLGGSGRSGAERVIQVSSI